MKYLVVENMNGVQDDAAAFIVDVTPSGEIQVCQTLTENGPSKFALDWVRGEMAKSAGVVTGQLRSSKMYDSRSYICLRPATQTDELPIIDIRQRYML